MSDVTIKIDLKAVAVVVVFLVAGVIGWLVYADQQAKDKDAECLAAALIGDGAKFRDLGCE